jgi:cytochrome oxidase Cu insertion factor (SCO1/SenC/PrrC family)
MRLLLAAALALAGCAPGEPARPEAGTVLPDFAMTAVGESGERPFGRAEMLGRPWVVGFVFTRCAGPCPLVSERMRTLARSLPEGVGLLTVTVDPDGDDAERLRAYARRLGADERRWVFLRGDLPQTYRLLYEGFRLPLSIDPAAQPERRATHSTRLVLVGPRGEVRGSYDSLSDLDENALARDARRLLEADS